MNHIRNFFNLDPRKNKSENELWEQREFGTGPATITTIQEYLEQDLETVRRLEEKADRLETECQVETRVQYIIPLTEEDEEAIATPTPIIEENIEENLLNLPIEIEPAPQGLSKETQQINPNNLGQLPTMDGQQLTQLITAMTQAITNNRQQNLPVQNQPGPATIHLKSLYKSQHLGEIQEKIIWILNLGSRYIRAHNNNSVPWADWNTFKTAVTIAFQPPNYQAYLRQQLEKLR
ncbi:hypothetical protein Glove_365g243 [Diversispora epigaea]|uniref:Uncharacterized protein n=1 Tax=Diversispora epigaea TaxID=1348612 RepID=A0A397HBM2_9GLOM|nr:hypothetical protein Glove_365g243 [Diversispora epigaea]